MTDLWSERAEAYSESDTHREGRDLDLLVSWAEGKTALDVATGGGHVARRLRERGLEVTTLDPAPGMRADVLAPAEHIPFADGSFDTVATRIAPHHFTDIRAAVVEMARVARRVVLVEDTLYDSEEVEEAERLHDPTHVRSYSEEEWRSFLEDAGLTVERIDLQTKRRDFVAWCDRTGCTGAERERARQLRGDRIDEQGGEGEEGGVAVAIVVGKETKLVVQGATGREGSFHTLRNRSYGTDVVAGVTPGKGGQDLEGIPIFDTVAEAVEEAGANTSMVFVPGRFGAGAVYAGVDSGIRTVI